MIIDGHAHACGVFLRAENIVRILNREYVDRVVLVPGELGSAKNYNLPDLARWFPNRDVVPVTNAMTKFVVALTMPPLISLARLRKALDYFGADRLVLGSDTPYGADTLRRNLQRLFQLL